MQRRPATHRRIASVIVAVLVSTPNHSAESQGRSAAETARFLVAAQASTEYVLGNLRVNANELRPDEISVDSIGSVGSMVLWRARVHSASHFHPYLVGTSVEGVYRLGGFGSPELTRLPGRVERLDSADVWARARQLAIAADPNGAVSVVSASAATPDEVTIARILGHWRQNKPKSWPEERVTATGRGVLVTLTVVSRRDWAGYGDTWLPIAYAFEFGTDGRLLAWSRLVGTAITD